MVEAEQEGGSVAEAVATSKCSVAYEGTSPHAPRGERIAVARAPTGFQLTLKIGATRTAPVQGETGRGKQVSVLEIAGDEAGGGGGGTEAELLSPRALAIYNLTPILFPDCAQHPDSSKTPPSSHRSWHKYRRRPFRVDSSAPYTRTRLILPSSSHAASTPGRREDLTRRDKGRRWCKASPLTLSRGQTSNTTNP